MIKCLLPGAVLLVFVFGWLGCAGSAPKKLNIENRLVVSESTTPITNEWPPLPATGFIRGRPASEKDVEEGNAVFVAADAGKVIGDPLPLEIPQYAFRTDEESRGRYRVIVIQAERAKGYEMIGFRNIDTGEFGVGLKDEFELLGTVVSKLP